VSYELVSELESRHLRAFHSEHSSNWGAELRREAQAWADLKVSLARNFAEGHSELVAILSEAPDGTITDPAGAAFELLANASPAGVEEGHLRHFMSEHSSNWGTELRSEVTAWANSRIKVAKMNAKGLVQMATAHATNHPPLQRSVGAVSGVLPPVEPAEGMQRDQRATATADANTSRVKPRHRGTYRGTVVSINAHGAIVGLHTGESGWLHVSKLRVLNGGSRVDDVATLLHVGQEVDVKGVGTTSRGQVQLALLKPTVRDHDGGRAPAASTQAGPEPAAKKRRLLARLLTPQPK
jgi:predicted RNA-binding protein with RPS1 domain